MKFLMNLALTSMMAASSSIAFAEKYHNEDEIPVPAVEPVPACMASATEVATILTQASEELAILKSKQTDINIGVECVHEARGVTRYEFKFRNCGMCFPVQNMLLTVTLDRNPMLVDGAPIYTKSLR